MKQASSIILVQTFFSLITSRNNTPALGFSQFQTLEYFDLRELQDLIVSKDLWPDFEPHFRSKENLNIKFDQLSELRNGIQHSRTVDEIVLKEGEASILWFEKILQK